MSNSIQPNGMPHQSFMPKPSASQKMDRALMASAKAENQARFGAVRAAAYEALRLKEITGEECRRRVDEATASQRKADRDASEAIIAARRVKTAQAA